MYKLHIIRDYVRDDEHYMQQKTAVWIIYLYFTKKVLKNLISESMIWFLKNMLTPKIN